MKKAQGSLEYLLILAAILAIAVVVVLVATSLLATPEEATGVGEDKYLASVAGVTIEGYNTPFDGSVETAPTAFTYKDKNYAYFDAVGPYALASGLGGTDITDISFTNVIQLNGHDLALASGPSGEALVLEMEQSVIASLFGLGTPVFGGTAPGPSTGPDEDPLYFAYTPS